MSWRRFLTLCQNLNPYGATAVQIRAQEEKKPDPDEVDEEEERRKATAFFSSIVGI